MPRKNRVWYPGAAYHIICRGNYRQEIFRDDIDRLVYLSILRKIQKDIPYLMYSYCLMPNHVHLQIETGDINISQVMKKINMMYAIYFNKKYDIVGHLFQDRYRAELIGTEPYHLEVSRYIHLNPVRANMAERPDLYRWSSYNVYVGKQQDQLISTKKTLGCFSPPRIKNYRNFVEEEL
ncbi:MAG: transposase [Desulfotomaculaceae bacterium]|nr:transposase [Desulfotomaculaceae bacterium]